MNTETVGPVAAIITAKAQIIALLRAWINQRPGLDFANYGDPTSYRAEIRSITRQRADTLQLLRAVELRDSITADHIREAFPRAFSGRLELIEKDGKMSLNYCAGQYWPTEYRAAAAAVLAAVLWGYFRANMPEPDGKKMAGVGAFRYETETYRGKSAGDYLRTQARNEFGRGIASRWFN